ncbi:MAG: GNAT family N-acetyltransferase [Clostridia bacterium]|nr:GNAT family N-acetyltransferase [Clostridia bacterium]
MNYLIKPMETPEEIKGKAYVHWRSWQAAYAGIINRDYLAALTLEKCEQIAGKWRDNILVALENGRVIGFAGYGESDAEFPQAGAIFALYVLPEYFGKGAGRALAEAALEKLQDRAEIRLWVLKENARAIKFYEKLGFAPDGREQFLPALEAYEIGMVLHR